MFRGNTDKLERHELRERALGEQLKKALAGLDKRQENAEMTVTQAFQTLEARLIALDGAVATVSRRESSYHINATGALLYLWINIKI